MQQPGQPIVMQQPAPTVIVVQGGGNQQYIEQKVDCCCCCEVPCGFNALGIVNVLNLYQLYGAFAAYQLFAYFNQAIAIIFLIFVVGAWIPVFVFWFHLIMACQEGGGKEGKTRERYVRAAQMLITSYTIQAISWPVFLLIIAGGVGFAVSIFPLIEFSILLCCGCWWLSSAKKYVVEGQRVDQAKGQ